MTAVFENQSAEVAKRNLAAAQLIYNLFLQGNIPAVLEMCSEDIVWKHGANPHIVPFGGTYKGKAGVLRFFEAVSQSVQMTRFEPHNFAAEGNSVTNDVHVELMVIPTEKTLYLPESSVWTFGDDGRVVQYETCGDMRALERAFL